MYDVIVIGLGVFGASTLKELSKTNLKVLGLDASTPGSMETLSFGQTRLFRQIYSQDSDLTEQTFLAKKAYKDLEKESGIKILTKTGFSSDYHEERHDEMAAAIQMAEQHKIPYRVDDCKGVMSMIELEACLIDVGSYFKAVAKTIKRTQVNYDENVLNISEEKEFLNVVTDKGEYQAKKIVLAAGQWSKKLSHSLKEDRVSYTHLRAHET